jgi:hypothetical protein
MKTLIERWKAKMPIFWKQVLAVAVVVGSAALGLKTGNVMFELNMPEIVIAVCNYILAVASTLGLAAKLTKMS